ncbi:MAG: hypothetical protein WC516_05845 [Patescibacteria group bacterium]|jgi:hypothetical protein
METRKSVNVYWLVKEYDEVVSSGAIHNTIVDDGLEQLDKLSNGVSSDYFDDIAIGTDSTAVTTSDSALGTEFDKQLATLTYTSSKAQWYYEFTFPSGTSESIEEIGVFNGASVMMNRALTGGIAVTAATTLQITVTLNSTRA